MFKKFTHTEEVSGVTQVKSSVQRGVRSKILELYPAIEPYISEIIPKKDPLLVVKCKDHIEILSVNQDLLFFKQRDGPWLPTLMLLHKYPFMMTQEQVDKGAIRFILSGANIMCPGLTSPGANLIPAEKNSNVAVMAEGKQHALAIGLMKLSSEEILEQNKGIAVDNVHYLNDGLWQMRRLERS